MIPPCWNSVHNMQRTYKLFDTDAKADLCKTKPDVFVIDGEYKGEGPRVRGFKSTKRLVCGAVMKVNFASVLQAYERRKELFCLTVCFSESLSCKYISCGWFNNT